MANSLLSIRGRSFSPAQMRRRLNVFRGGARLKRQSFQFNIDLRLQCEIKAQSGHLRWIPGAERPFAAHIAGCERVARVMLERLHRFVSWPCSKRIGHRMLSPNGREIDIRPTPNGSKGAGVTQCADYLSWRRDLWLQSLRDPGAYKIHDLRDYGLIDNPNEIPPFLAP